MVSGRRKRKKFKPTARTPQDPEHVGSQTPGPRGPGPLKILAAWLELLSLQAARQYFDHHATFDVTAAVPLGHYRLWVRNCFPYEFGGVLEKPQGLASGPAALEAR